MGVLANLKNKSYTKEQLEIGGKIIDILVKAGYSPFVDDDETGCRLDICVEVGILRQSRDTVGRFGIFWKSNKVQYLGGGEGHSDGYQINRGWQEINDIENVVSIYEKDMNEMKKYHMKYCDLKN